MSKMSLDGSELRTLLDWIGASAEPTPHGEGGVAEVEEWLGRPLPAELRQLLLASVTLEHHNAEHLYVDHEFLAGLPDVGAFLDGLGQEDQGRFNATVHLLGLYPIGVMLQYGDFMYAMACLDPHDGEHAGVMYYDEGEIGTWGATVSAFLHSAITSYWTQADGLTDGFDEEDLAEFEFDTHHLRDCFILDGYDHRTEPPPGAVPRAIEESWEPWWRARMDLMSRWWVNSFLQGSFAMHNVRELPNAAEWAAQRDEVAALHHQGMYWLLAHAILGNEAELTDCIARARSNPSRLVQVLADAMEADPTAGGRFETERAKVFELVRQAPHDG